jgi:FkbM family methyltransferase
VSKDLLRTLIPRPVRNAFRSPRKLAEWANDGAHFFLTGGRDYRIRSDWVLRSHPFAYRNSYEVHVVAEEAVRELDEFIARCRPGMCLYDIGCHFGIFTLAALRYGGSKARAFAFDPSAMAERYLLGNVSCNGWNERVAFKRVAVSNSDRDEYLVSHGLFGNGYFSTSTWSQHGQGERTRVPCRTIDSLVREFGVPPTHVKIDVEGFENEVLQGGQELLRHGRPILFLEVHNDMLRNRDVAPEKVFNMLGEYGYHRVATTMGGPMDHSSLARCPIVRLICEKD